MKIVPQNNYILCKKADEAKLNSGNIILPGIKSVFIYQILELGKSKDVMGFKKGDNVIASTTGTKIDANNNEYYLFEVSKIIAKIVD